MHKVVMEDSDEDLRIKHVIALFRALTQVVIQSLRVVTVFCRSICAYKCWHLTDNGDVISIDKEV